MNTTQAAAGLPPNVNHQGAGTQPQFVATTAAAPTTTGQPVYNQAPPNTTAAGLGPNTGQKVSVSDVFFVEVISSSVSFTGQDQGRNGSLNGKPANGGSGHSESEWWCLRSGREHGSATATATATGSLPTSQFLKYKIFNSDILE